MIIFTKHGDRSSMPMMNAYSKGVYIIKLYGEVEYNDPYDGSSWYWRTIDNSLAEVLGVIQEGNPLTRTLILNDCISLDGSWFWDDANGLLYVHWTDSVGDWHVDRDISILSKIASGYASGYVDNVHNVFDEVYYETRITKVKGLSKSVDPLELGLISFGDSSLSIGNYDGKFDDITESESTGLPIWGYKADQNTFELTNDNRIFTGYSKGTKNNRDDITYKIIETRLFENKPICQNAIDVVTYPDAGDKVGELMPVAFGDIRRGIMVRINEDAIGDPRTITFLVADPSLYSVLAISKVYDQNDNEVAISATNLVNCTVSISIAVADLDDYDFDEFSWEGQGYDIAGTYNNGLDIIKAGFLKFAGVPYLSSTYDQTKWTSETTENPEACGISVQSTKGFVEELIEPITVSLYGVVDILGDGRISFQSRDDTEPVKDTIYAVDQSTEPDINMNPDKTVSELLVKYSRNFVDDEKDLEFLYDDTKEETIGMYGIDTRDPVSPYETVLADLADVETISELIMDVISSPDKKIKCEAFRFLDLNIFDIIGIDVGRHNDVNILYGEILSFEPEYLQDRETVTIRVIDNPVLDLPPDVPEMITAFCSGAGKAFVKWSNEIATGYKLYYTDVAGNWTKNEILTSGTVDIDENRYYEISGLTEGSVYYFSVKSYNANGDSLLSNIRVCKIWTTGEENSYKLDSDFGTGLKINQLNPDSGVVPTGYTRYDQKLYDQACMNTHHTMSQE